MDEEGSKVRLVRCPNCENLLPELHGFSVYKCGGCAAVLRGNKQDSRSDDLVVKSDEEKVEGVSVLEKHFCEKTINSIDNSLSQDKVSVKAMNQNSVETMNLQHKKSTQKRDTAYSDSRYNTYSRGQFNKQVYKNIQVPDANSEFSISSNSREGSSSYVSNFPHDFGVNKRVENLEHDRAELLRKIDELKIQLCSCNDEREKGWDVTLPDRTTDVHLDKYNSYVPEGPRRANLQPIYRDYNHGHDLNMKKIYPPNRDVRFPYHQPYHDQFSGNNLGLNQKYIFPKNCEGSFNGPLCSCFQCYTKKMYTHNIFSSTGNNYNSGSVNGGLVTKAGIAHGNKSVFYPISGGVPFLACPRCFVLLNLPKILTDNPKNCKKIRCGACSVLISVDFEKNDLFIRISTKLRQVSTKGDVETLNEDFNILGDDLKVHECDNPIIFPQSIDVETNAVSRDHSVKSDISSKKQGLISSSSSFSEKHPSPDIAIIVRENSKSADLLLKDEDYADFVFSRCGMGNKSKRASRQNSVKDVQFGTEKEVVYNEIAVSEEERESRMEEERKSFLGGLFKKGFKDLLRPSRNVETSPINVFINGQPLSNRVVKKAEQLAGPIEPGNYWYDYRAGFWGVMGQSCHGIIPPFIEEFNYAMPRKCGAGNTGVFVNGRELHESDLDLLACRGLPTTKDKFYMIEISGRAVNEYTGEELDDLGKLAPTVEKVKHGFGMRPRAISE